MARQARLSRDAIVEAALALTDEVGSEALTMRALARRLGVDPMAVYRHFADKDDLMGAMCDAVLAELPQPETKNWQEAVVSLTDELLAALTRRPALIGVLAGAPATPAALVLGARALRILTEAGIDAERAATAWRLLFAAVIGWAAIDSAFEPPADASGLVAAAASDLGDDEADLRGAAHLLMEPGSFADARDLVLAGLR